MVLDEIMALTEDSSDFPALITAKTVINYGEYYATIRQAAAWLQKCGIRPGEKVGMWGGTSVEFILLLLGLIASGAVACPLSSRLKPHQIPKYLKTVGSRKLLLFNEIENYELPSGFSVIDAAQFKPAAASSGEQTSGLRQLFGEDAHRPATVIFTSGSTGEPKGALLTLANHLYNAAGSNRNIPFEPGDCWSLSLPLYHVGGLSLLFRALLGGGALVIPPAGQKPADVLRQYKITHLSLVATQLYRLLNAGLAAAGAGALKAVLLGGGPLPEKIIRRAVERGLPLYCTYGCTEMASQVTTTGRPASIEELLTSGKTLAYRELRISPEGEIQVRGKTRFCGYLQNSVLRKPFLAGGWFATGDLGRLDASGNLVVMGRKDNMFVSGGENIQPEEIEQVLLSLDSIERAMVVPVPDPEFGARSAAFVQLSAGALGDGKEIRTKLETLLPGYKIPIKFLPWPRAAESKGIKPSRKKFQALAAELFLVSGSKQRDGD